MPQRLDGRRHRRPSANAATTRDRTTTHRYYQEDVHDFAWTTSPDYRGATARDSSTRRCRRSRCGCCSNRSTRQAERHFDATRTTLKYYGEWFGPYPYGHITIVDPA